MVTTCSSKEEDSNCYSPQDPQKPTQKENQQGYCCGGQDNIPKLPSYHNHYCVTGKCAYGGGGPPTMVICGDKQYWGKCMAVNDGSTYTCDWVAATNLNGGFGSQNCKKAAPATKPPTAAATTAATTVTTASSRPTDPHFQYVGQGLCRNNVGRTPQRRVLTAKDLSASVCKDLCASLTECKLLRIYALNTRTSFFGAGACLILLAALNTRTSFFGAGACLILLAHHIWFFIIRPPARLLTCKHAHTHARAHTHTHTTSDTVQCSGVLIVLLLARVRIYRHSSVVFHGAEPFWRNHVQFVRQRPYFQFLH